MAVSVYRMRLVYSSKHTQATQCRNISTTYCCLQKVTSRRLKNDVYKRLVKLTGRREKRRQGCPSLKPKFFSRTHSSPSLSKWNRQTLLPVGQRPVEQSTAWSSSDCSLAYTATQLHIAYVMSLHWGDMHHSSTVSCQGCRRKNFVKAPECWPPSLWLYVHKIPLINQKWQKTH